ncbi:hypothetical protein DV26_01910 [Amycolatopsis mediterranei]|nr:hypothetical protein DV26_01910 [Amycolatopsis mediterranei]KDU88503.1 hypothetical protein DV36_29700 [Amycolatopsis mediterranei]
MNAAPNPLIVSAVSRMTARSIAERSMWSNANRLPGADNRPMVTSSRSVSGMVRYGNRPSAQPRRRLRRVESHGGQRARPGVAQIEPDHDPFGGRRGTLLGQHRLLELEHLRQVHFEHPRRRRPAQPECPGIQTRPQQHYLPHTRRTAARTWSS